MIETRQKNQIETDADKATEIILSGLRVVHPFVKDKVRQAYLLGRAHQAADNLDTLIKTCKSQAR